MFLAARDRLPEQIHCIEFPSILLPAGCTTGSVVSISCTRNKKEEQARNDEFWDLQDDILAAFGERTPSPPRLRLRNVTQTSVTLEWDKLELATAKLLSLTIWRNGQRLAAIPNPLNNTSTKVSGLDVDAPYSFHLIVRTTAGTYASQTIKTRTLTLADTSGISACFGAIEPSELLDEAKEALTQMRARWSNRIQIETTHFVCTHSSGAAPAVTPPDDSPHEAPDPGMEFQRATQLSIPVVQPAWVLACLREKRMVPISSYTLDKAPISGGPASSVSLGKNASARSQQHPPQQPRDTQREPIQLQKPPPPKHSPEVRTTKALPDAEPSEQPSADTAMASDTPLPPTALPEEGAPETAEGHEEQPLPAPGNAEAVESAAPAGIELAPTALPEAEEPEDEEEADVGKSQALKEESGTESPTAAGSPVAESISIHLEADEAVKQFEHPAGEESPPPTQQASLVADTQEMTPVESEVQLVGDEQLEEPASAPVSVEEPGKADATEEPEAIPSTTEEVDAATENDRESDAEAADDGAAGHGIEGSRAAEKEVDQENEALEDVKL